MLGDVWEWSGSDWTQLTYGLPNQQPFPRYGAAMAFSAANGQIVLFGGYGRGFMNDTWSWNGTSWTQITLQTSPSPRVDAAYASDPANGQIVLYGGKNGSGLSDTWLYLAEPMPSQPTTVTTAQKTTATTNSHQTTPPTTAAGSATAPVRSSSASDHRRVNPAANVPAGPGSTSSPTATASSQESGTTIGVESPAPEDLASKPVSAAGRRERSGHSDTAGFDAGGIVAAVLLAVSASGGTVLVRRIRRESL